MYTKTRTKTKTSLFELETSDGVLGEWAFWVALLSEKGYTFLGKRKEKMKYSALRNEIQCFILWSIVLYFIK